MSQHFAAHRRRQSAKSTFTVGAALLVALVVVGSACAAKSDLGSGFQLSADQLTASEQTARTVAPGTTSSTKVPGDWTVQIATANVGTVDVYESIPGDTSSTIPQPPQGSVAPIPRADLNSEGIRLTSTGWQFDNPTTFDNELVFLVEEHKGTWLKVNLPVRPNGSMGWVQSSQVTISETDYHIEVALGEAMVRAYDGDDLIGESYVVIGTSSTPTPTGRFYVNEIIDTTHPDVGSGPNGSWGYWILSTNAYSETMEFFQGGLPVVALHGTNQPQLLGSANSNGCIRMPNDLDVLLANSIPAGTPVEISL